MEAGSRPSEARDMRSCWPTWPSSVVWKTKGDVSVLKSERIQVLKWLLTTDAFSLVSCDVTVPVAAVGFEERSEELREARCRSDVYEGRSDLAAPCGCRL